MKRILSILLSVTIVASLLVSMSVTSFAFDKVLYTDTTPSADTTLEITVEKGDATVIENTGLENPYVITFTLDNYGTLNAWKASNKQNGTRLPGVEIGFTFTEDGAPADPDAIWWYADESTEIGTEDVTTYDPETLEYDFGFGKGAAAAYPVGTTGGVVVTDPIVMKFVFATMPSDTFRINIGTATTFIAYTFQDYNANNNVGPGRVVGLVSSPQTSVPIEFPTTLYVKEGVQVTEEEYYGSSEPATHNITVYANGEELMNETIAEGEAISMPVAPAVTGKTFSHWATTEGGSAVEPATTMGTEDLTYYAVYTVNKYTITFVVDGNTTTKEVEHGTIPTFDGSLVKDGYTFTGWDNEIVAATGAATYTAQFEKNAPTQYEITFVVDGVETKVMTNAGETPVFPGTPAKDGYNFLGWNPTLAPATGVATYTAQFELIPVEPEVSAVEITTVSRITGDIFPESGEAKVTVVSFGNNYTVSAARLHRVHTTFDYDASVGTLKEMGMLFVPKAVADEAGASTAEAIVAAGIAKDANCRSLPAEITGGTTGVIFKAGLVDVPEEFKGITIYAIPYYTLSGGARQYHGVVTTTF